MKKFLIALNILIWSIVCVEIAHAETKKVCHEKNGKQVCKMVKIHEKIAGATKVPEKKKK
jgi:hypothetical protein